MGADVKKASGPNIFNYYDYRKYLNDVVAYERQRSSVFSHRYIVQKAGFKSPTALKHVIDGKRNLSLEAANRFAAALKIEGIPRHYFLTLVLFNQSASMAEQEKYLKELLELKRAENPSRLDEDRFEVLSQWYHLAIREIVGLPDFKNSAKWIARVLCPHITPFEASQSLLLLKRLGLIKKIDGRIQPSESILATENQFQKVHSVKAVEFHRQMIQRGAESITRFLSDEREISGTVLRISRQDVLNVKTLLRELRKKLLALAANSHEADQVYQLNFQFFPLVIPERSKRLIAEQEDV
ncbi:MAG: TIGR02147 family protein [Chitinispirillaceae bacterium]|nr:TIGR02147 family protein [Chitinispirillaceae bacterium]